MADQPKTPEVKFADLGVRFASAVFLIAVAVLAFWNDIAFATLFVSLGAGLMLWEYRRIVRRGVSLTEPVLWITIIFSVLAVMMTGYISLWGAAIPMAVGVALLAWRDRDNLRWMGPGFVYITLALCVLVDMRRTEETGLLTVLWMILVVVAADVGGYFAGRTFGGPKLWPKVSPKKTWSGAIGGLVLALCVGLVFWVGGWGANLAIILPLSVAVAVASQAGDLLESSIKRHFGVKDSSALIPGHGGLLDRFDGLLGGLLMFGLVERLGLLTG
ncbi:phosphatidate cytidylyltransferase [Algicella marina]|nr:phosphatidate cytidylyltransferase [Algicella marina]